MKKMLLAITLLVAGKTISAQEIGQILAGSTADANKYLQSYFEPFAKGEILNMGRGWTNTARVHKMLGFDISVNAQLALVPDNASSFVFNKADYSTFTLTNGASSATVPTFMGNKMQQSITVNTTVNGKNVKYNFNTPTGVGDDIKNAIGKAAVPLPVVQIGLGLIKHTDIKVRFFPKTDVGGTKLGVFGLAIQHEFSNYLPFLKKAPFLHLSALAGYNSVNASYDLSGKGVNGSNQQAELNISGFTLQGLASVKLAIFDIYTSFGITSGKCDANMKGTYTFTYNDPTTGLPAATASVTDPVSLRYTNSGVSNTWGIRANILFLKVFADYTFSKYNGAGAGVAFSFR